MDNEVNQLIQAWKICMDGTCLDAQMRQKAYNYIENFKQTSPNLLQVGFYLANQSESFELSHFGYQLIVQTIKFKWNEFDQQFKTDVKTQIMNILNNLDVSTRARPSYLKNAMCLVIIELVRREWPQNWPNLINDLFDISNKSIEHKKFIFIILKYMAEEFIDADSSSIAQLPPQRRKDINQYLNQYMDKIFTFYLDCLEYCFNHLNAEHVTLGVEHVELANVCLDSLANYIGWLNIDLILSKNYLLINVCLSLLNNAKLCITSAKCLVGLSNRKGTAVERKPLLGMFNESVLYTLINCIKLSIENADYKELFKYIVQLLVGMGNQLNFLWDSNQFDQRPASLGVYLNALYEILQTENRLNSFEIIALWNVLLQNEFIVNDAELKRYVILIGKLLTNSYLMFKFTYSSMANEFDNEDEFNKFQQRYRYELGRLIRLAGVLDVQSFVDNAYDWSQKIVAQTGQLTPDDQTGYDPTSFLYLCWDALIFLWTNLIQVLIKNQARLNLPATNVKSQLISLVSSSVGLNSRNANYSSFNYSFLSALLNFTCDLCADAVDDKRPLILKTILDKLFKDLDAYRLESARLLAAERTSNTSVMLRYLYNVRRQISAIVLNVSKSYTRLVKDMLEGLFGRIVDILNQSETTQMEKCILIQVLVCISNESGAELQLSLVKQFLDPMLEFYNRHKADFSNVDNFISLIGVDQNWNKPGMDEQSAQAHSANGLANRKLIFYHVNSLFGILKTINLSPTPENQQISSIFIGLFEYLLDLIKCLNQLHASARINKDYLDMTDNIKTLVLGMQQEKHALNAPVLNAMDPNDNPEKTLMFIYNTYDTLNQLIGLYLVKFKQQLLLVAAPPADEFICRFGESLMACFTQLPDFRIRSLLKYVLKVCVTVVNFDKETLGKNLLITRLNQVLLEYVLPSILSRITDTNRLQASLKLANEQAPADNETLKNQIIAENQFVLMCREFAEFIRVLFNFNNQQQQQQQQANSSTNEMDEMTNQPDENESAIIPQPSAEAQFNELIIHLLKTNKIIYQTLILCLFDGLTWPDSYCCLKFVKLAQSLIEKYSIASENAIMSDQFSIQLNAQASERIFTLCLSALQVHGEHQDTCSHLINLAYAIYDKSSVEHKSIFNAILAQIPDLNRKTLDEFIAKAYVQPAKVPVSQSQEKLKKDLFKKSIQPMVGKSIGQLYKNEIKIRVLEPLNLKSKKHLTNDCESSSNGNDLSICSLFDPKNF